MTYLVGCGPHRSDAGALELACQLAATRPAAVTTVSVVPRGWGTPVAGDTDREFENWAAEEGEAAAAEALEFLASRPVEASAHWVAGRSVPQTLLEQVAETGAQLLIVGSSSEADEGRIKLTSKTDRLVHSSPVPVAIAPHGYTASGAFTRVTVGFRGDDASWSLLNRVSALALETGATLRVVTFVVSPSRRPVTSTVSHAETQVIQQWAAQAEQEQAAAREQLHTLGFSDERLELRRVDGADWKQAISAIDWHEGDLLVVGSSSTHPFAQVFLGSSAAKIVRYSPVPVVVVPSGSA